ncbi:jacalin-like lectin [uncultured Shewanella sp.]|uniref:jacalin-like lectin n=1 Tax=uncultured Shewanella sp. TaxID=173975 RepID=UPI002602C6B0|nr:jacalin-like lectin [uncultured Shewanella sp.]
MYHVIKDYFRHFLSLVKLTLIICISSSALANTESDEDLAHASKALKLQQHLDASLPLSQSFWPGAHNAYASEDWGYVNANQQYRLERLLNHGIREMSLDIYPALVDFKYEPYLCHNSLEEDAYCTAGNRSLAEGLREVRDFLGNEDNDQSVIMLKLEVYRSHGDNGHLRRVREKIEDVLGDHVYKPKDSAATNYGEHCGSLPVASISKNDVLSAGKNVIVLLTNDSHSCTYYKEGNLHQWVWYGVDEFDATLPGNVSSHNKFTSIQDIADCNSTDNNTKQFSMLRGVDAKTADGGGDLSLTTASTPDLMACGLNIAEAALIGHGAGGIKTRDFIWSWNFGEPNDAGGEDCAEIYGIIGKFNDAQCSIVQRFICRTPSNDFAISTSSGSWHYGVTACSEIGASFTVPKSAIEMRAVKNLLNQLDVNKVWANYHDQSVEGDWQIDNPVVRKVESLPIPPEGGPGGASFLSEDILNAYISGALNRISTITIHAGARVDAVQVNYDNGIEQWIGDIGGVPNVLALQANEYITGYKTCYHKNSHVGSRRLFYLRLTTSSGRTIEGGQQEGTCRADVFLTKGLLGFHGRRGHDPDALGFYVTPVTDLSQVRQVGLVNGGANGKFMAAELAGGDNVVVNRTAKGPWETFNIHYARDMNNGSNGCLGTNQFIKIQTLGGYWFKSTPGGNLDALATNEADATTFEIFSFKFGDVPDGECVAKNGGVFFKAVESNYFISQQNDNAVTNKIENSLSGFELFSLVE